MALPVFNLLACGLVIEDCPILAAASGKAWCALPAKPDLDETGKQRSDEAGKRLWLPVVKWSTRELGDTFSVAVVEAIRRAYSGILDADQPGLDLQ